jgi:eukaryotic-like serine/threonine-protein kinase
MAMLATGSVVCGYRIQRVLGTGGMGAVYLADDPALPRQIALKVLSAELAARRIGSRPSRSPR